MLRSLLGYGKQFWNMGRSQSTEGVKCYPEVFPNTDTASAYSEECKMFFLLSACD